jgi:hypothetical protein
LRSRPKNRAPDVRPPPVHLRLIEDLCDCDHLTVAVDPCGRTSGAPNSGNPIRQVRARYPIAPLVFTAEEVQNGTIPHAIRFILPNDRIKGGVFVGPSTHTTNAASAGRDGLPYGTRLRLKASFDISGLSPGAQVVAKALKKYGMFLSDGGETALTAANDRFSSVKWSGLLGGTDLESIKVTDFEVVKHETNEINYGDNCTRN